jgi:hypothetical protein
MSATLLIAGIVATIAGTFLSTIALLMWQEVTFWRQTVSNPVGLALFAVVALAAGIVMILVGGWPA